MTVDNVRPDEFKGKISENRDWREIVAWIGDLPPIPHVASRAIAMVEDPDATATALSDILANDAALAARVLKIANSAMFSRQREISTLNQAVMVIGFKSLKGIIVAASLRQLNRTFGKNEKLVWENSMCTAMCSTLLAKRLKKSFVEEIFLLGLLHSLGQIVLLFHKETSQDYKKVMALIRDTHLDYLAAEQEVFGFGHPLIGALVAKKWNFSSETCQVILHYKDDLNSKEVAEEINHKTAIVQLADLLSHAAGVGSPEGYPEQSEKIHSLAKFVGFEESKVAEIMEEVINETQAQFESESHIYD